jgi:predicted transcriptional regulator of viral defense system
LEESIVELFTCFHLKKVLFLTSNSDKMYIQFRNHFANLPILSLIEIEKAFPKLDKRRLNEWSKKGYLENVKRGFYRFTDLPKQEGVLFFSANKIYSPSYISLESALSFHKIIPEAVFSVTSVSTLNTTNLKTSLGSFNYNHVKENLFFGYVLNEINGLTVSMASLEKAILDYLYLHSEIKSVSDVQGLRWNIEGLRKMNIQKMDDYLLLFNNKSLSQRYSLLKKYMYD